MRYVEPPEERPHICVVCSEGFHTEKELKDHHRVHVGSPPYACTLCEKDDFRTVGEVEYHYYCWHRKTYPCEMCAFAFYSEDRLKEHTEKDHNYGAPSTSSSCQGARGHCGQA